MSADLERRMKEASAKGVSGVFRRLAARISGRYRSLTPAAGKSRGAAASIGTKQALFCHRCFIHKSNGLQIQRSKQSRQPLSNFLKLSRHYQ